MNPSLKLKILQNPFISAYDKHIAIKDIEAMQVWQSYKEITEYDHLTDNLTDAFRWEKSLLGSDFWKTISAKLDSHENS